MIFLKALKKFIVPVIFTVITVALAIIVLKVDVAPVGVNGTSIGLSTINVKMRDAIGTNLMWYKVTEIIGYIAILLCAMFGLVGLIQWIKRKNILKVDTEILCLGVLYIITIAFYVFFLKADINLRPIVMPGETAPEASFPSSHTMLACVVFGSAIMIVGKYIKKGIWAEIAALLLGVLIGIMVTGRLLSGVHWLTDIIVGVVMGATLLTWFKAFLNLFNGTLVKGKHG